MKYRLLKADGERTFVIVGDPGDDAVDTIGRFARDQNLSAASLTAVGAFARATVGWFDREAKDYRRIAVAEQCEVLSLLGDVAVGDDAPVAHIHAVLGLADGTVRGGHLLADRRCLSDACRRLAGWGTRCAPRWLPRREPRERVAAPQPCRHRATGSLRVQV